MQQLRKERFVFSRARLIEFHDTSGLQTLAHYQPLNLAQIPIVATW